jgi:hypothetical protein
MGARPADLPSAGVPQAANPQHPLYRKPVLTESPDLGFAYAASEQEEMNAFYREFLKIGFVVMRQAIRDGNLAWIAAEAELLHNVPSLIDEQNVERHCYF